MPYKANDNELEILEFWKKNKIFEKSVDGRPEDKPYVFYDGPPFATGLPHYGHILSSVIKDVVPRYMTMKGYRVRRRWGWDCHGLPIESLIEKDLSISDKKDIENKVGIEKFNEACCSAVLRYAGEWKKMVERIGRWVEFDNSYKTMDSTYMESVWWALKMIWDKGLIYEGRKVLMYCPRCETPVSKAEIAMDNSYKDITEESVIVKFKIINSNFGENVFILAWTTTPWTLPGNVALAVGQDIDYAIVEIEGERFILAKDRLNDVMEGKIYKVIKEVKGSDLVGLSYEPLFNIGAVENSGKKAWYVTSADFVTTDEGTGVVHTAVIYGEDDFNLGLSIDLPMVPLLDEKGIFNSNAPEFIVGQYFKDAEKDIKEYLSKENLLFKKEVHAHSYPFCWRCDTQLFYNAISAWFIDIQKIKDKMIKLNEKINWYPEHLKHGRFLNILKTAPDWNISRNRYWATPLPFWKCQKDECKNVVCIGSVDELRRKAVNFDKVYETDKIEEMNLHKDQIDKIKLRCGQCGDDMIRIPEVIDCWVESASMPFAEFHYPFENESVFKARFPGQYIAEYIAQTRAWFYYMHVMAVLLFDDVSFENVVTTGTILNDKGEKLSKSKNNFTDPWVIIEEYGVDALRYYLMTSVVMQAENLFFNDREVRDVYNKVINIIWNVVTFYKMYLDERASYLVAGKKVEHVLDKWILTRLNQLLKDVTKNMDNYNTVKAGRPIREFIDDLSTWYVRRSRDRFKHGTEEDKQAALVILREVLLALSKVMAPFTPFIAEKIYREAGGEAESVHLEAWPDANKYDVDEKLIDDMEKARKAVEMGMSLRKEYGIKVRQPLSEFLIFNFQFSNELLRIIADELNIKNVVCFGGAPQELNDEWKIQKDAIFSAALNINITADLKKEGLAREVIHIINRERKEQKLTRADKAAVEYDTDDELLKSVFEDFANEIKKQTGAEDLRSGGGGKEADVNGIKLKLEVIKN